MHDTYAHSLVSMMKAPLPNDVKVKNAWAALETFTTHGVPRIKNECAEVWGNPEFDQWMTKMLVMDRPGRQGFPVEVASALMVLSQEHDRLFREKFLEQAKADAEKAKAVNRFI